MLTIAIWAPINKKTLFLFVVLMPLIIRFAQNAFLDLASMSDSFENEGFADRINRSANSENVARGLDISNPGVFLHTLLQYVSFYVPLFYVAKTVLGNDYSYAIGQEYIKLFKVMIAFVLLSTIFLFFEQGSFVMYYRVLFMSMIPICLLIYISFNEQLISYKSYKAVVGIACFNSIIRTIYDLYACLI